MFVCESMREIASVLEVINSSKSIEVVHFKDRFKNPNSGWRDVMINYRITDDQLPHSGHVCELQISLSRMLTARKKMNGHQAYQKERNSREILEFLKLQDQMPKHVPHSKYVELSLVGDSVQVWEFGRFLLRS